MGKGTIKQLWVVAAAVSMLAVGPWVASAASAQPTGARQAPLTAAQAEALSTHVNQKVIVVLRDQVAAYSASKKTVGKRAAAEASEQKPILEELGATKAGGVHVYTTLNALSATVSPGEARRLASNPAVAEVIPDEIVHLASPFTAPSGTTHASYTAPPDTCSSDPANPMLEPQAIQTIHAQSSDPAVPTARSLGLDGSGVTVAWIADGVDINNPDFMRGGESVFVDYKDFSGEGTNAPTGGVEAFLDSSSIAAQGNDVYDVSQFSALSLSSPCYIRIVGVAPGANLVGLDVFGSEDAGFNSSILQAIDYAVSVDHVNVLNESFGSNPFPDIASADVIRQADDAAVAAGTTVTVSSGDAGVTNTIGSPSTDPNVISAGASTTYQLPTTLGYGGSQFGVTGWLDNNISSLSSSGFNQAGRTVSLVAPGELNWILCSTTTAMYSECTTFRGKATPVDESGGTSESAPLTAGTAALVIQAYEKTHSGSAPSPALVKQIIVSTTDDISAPADLQGAGLLDAYRAVVAAESYQVPPPAGAPDTTLDSSTQFNAVGATSTPEEFTENLTNLGSKPETLALSSRTLGAYSTIKTATVTLSDTASPQSTDYQGITDNYELVTFTVPSGVDRLNGSIAFQGSSSALAARVRLALVDPLGRLADYSLPQGVGNYGDVQVAEPMAGTWTAYIWSRDSAAGGTTGPVLFGASVASFGPFGTVSPGTLILAPGATSPVTLSVSTPSTPGDEAGSLLIGSGSGPEQTVPVTLRSLAPSGRTSFSGVLTGGNGRTPFTGVTEYYQFQVPSGSPELNASVTLADNPNNQEFAWLVDPSGLAEAYQSNGVITFDSSGHLVYTNTLGTNLHVLTPAAGLWTLIIDFAPTVSGMSLSEGFTVGLNQSAVPVSAPGLPNSKHITIKPGHAHTYGVRVTNTGTAPEAYFVDARLDSTTAYDLPALFGSSTNVPLTFSQNIPQYLVPSDTTELDASASTSGTEPIQFDSSSPAGDPDVASNQGLNVSSSVTGTPLSSGEWSIAPTTVGPFGAAGAASEPVHTAMTAVTQTFDPSVSSATGDLWQLSLGGPFTVSTLIVQPGHSATIPVSIKPSAPKGSMVSGTIYVDDDSLFLFGGLVPNANQVAAIPYSYKVG